MTIKELRAAAEEINDHAGVILVQWSVCEIAAALILTIPACGWRGARRVQQQSRSTKRVARG